MFVRAMPEPLKFRYRRFTCRDSGTSLSGTTTDSMVGGECQEYLIYWDMGMLGVSVGLSRRSIRWVRIPYVPHIVSFLVRWQSWSIAPVLKTGGPSGSVGSNPTLTAK